MLCGEADERPVVMTGGSWNTGLVEIVAFQQKYSETAIITRELYAIRALELAAA